MVILVQTSTYQKKLSSLNYVIDIAAGGNHSAAITSVPENIRKEIVLAPAKILTEKSNTNAPESPSKTTRSNKPTRKANRKEKKK